MTVRPTVYLGTDKVGRRYRTTIMPTNLGVSKITPLAGPPGHIGTPSELICLTRRTSTSRLNGLASGDLEVPINVLQAPRSYRLAHPLASREILILERRSNWFSDLQPGVRAIKLPAL